MKSKILRNLLLVCIVVIIGNLSCKKFLEISPPENHLITDLIFTNDSLAEAAVTGIYINIMRFSPYLLNGGLSIYGGTSADEVERINQISLHDQDFYLNKVNPTNIYNYIYLWKAGYYTIYQTNICLEGLANSKSINSTTRNRLTGEALFMRSLCFFYLLNLYGEIPLVTNTDHKLGKTLFQSSIEETYDKIVSDLLKAQDLLSFDNENTRPGSYASTALLARTYLYRSKWNKAEEASSKIINDAGLNLELNLNEVFKKGSKEILFQIAPVAPPYTTSEGFNFNPIETNNFILYKITPHLFNAIEKNDYRYNWIDSVFVSNIKYYYPRKYKLKTSTSLIEYNVILRLAEQYLIRAEARAQQDNIPGALADINVIRNRAGLNLLTSIEVPDREACLRAIMQERRVEFFAEWGHRWFDLKRTGKVEQVIISAKGDSAWTDGHELFPIPFQELQNAPNLKQNTGYN